MSGIDLFAYVWLGILALIAIACPILAIRDLRRGSAQFLRFDDYLAERDMEPFEFWLAVWSKLLICPVAIYMFFSGLPMLEWS